MRIVRNQSIGHLTNNEGMHSGAKNSLTIDNIYLMAFLIDTERASIYFETSVKVSRFHVVETTEHVPWKVVVVL